MVPPVDVPHLPGRGTALGVQFYAGTHFMGVVAKAHKVVGHLLHGTDGTSSRHLVAVPIHLLPLHQHVRHVHLVEQLG